MAEHSKLFSPSRAEMRLACPGSARMEELYPDTGPKPYAEEGSAAHHLCERCLKSVSDALGRLPGVVQVEVSLAAGQAVVTCDPLLVRPAELSDAIEEAGFDAQTSA